MTRLSLTMPSSGLRVFSASLLSALLIMMPFVQLAAAAKRSVAMSQKSESRGAEVGGQGSESKSAKSSAEKLFVNPPVVAGPITATKTDSYTSAPGAAAPGDTITYTVDLANTGIVDAASVAFADTIDANTTLVPGSLKASPVAINDTYSAIQNTPLNVAAPGVLSNDSGLPAPTATAIVAGATTAGGTITLNADGSFTYTAPNAGFTGADTFTYTITNAQAPPNPGVDNVATVTINVDAAPTVSSTTPTNGAVNQATNTNIDVTFSEAVNVTGSWFTISCATSGAHTAAVTGGPTTFTLNPNTDFTQGETCTVTIVAAQVTDQDSNDPPDNMAADYVFSFTMDAAPSVSSTTPTNGATNVATNSNITLNFSESVSLGATPVTISCATSGAHTSVISASPNTTFTVNPNVDFAGGELCTVTVVAAQVSDTDANDPPNNMVADYVFSFTSDAAPTVTATTPTNGATNQPTNTDITLTFSESVTLGATPVTISCTTSGAHTSVVSASPNTSFTVNPNVDFAANETCTVTVLAAQVTDTDAGDPPDNMAANFVFSFSTDAAPAVTTVTPTNGSTQVASNTNIVVNFSENVNIVDATAFTVECPGGSPVAFSVTPVAPGATNSFTIDPNSDLPLNTICTVTVVASKVTDTDSNDPPDNMAANFVFSFTIDNLPSVTTTVPTNGAINVAENANITVNFSENVNATTSSFTIECPAPGNLKTFTVSGSGTSAITLDPTADLPPGVICTVTVIANQISDTDAGDPPDNLAANFVFSFGVKPRAVDDARNATGNIRLQTAGRSGFTVLTNDIGPGITVTAFDATSLRGGQVSVASDGTFTYNPRAGYEGADSFNYTITNSAGSDVGTVNITVAGLIWFINTAPPATACATLNGICGRLSDPLTSLPAFEAANGGATAVGGDVVDPEAGDHIFIYTGSAGYVGPLTLEANQRVIGQGAQQTLQILSGITPATDSDTLPSTGGTRPSIITGGFNVVSNNQLYGLNFDDTTSTAINSTANVGTFIIADIGILNDASNGAGIILDDGGTFTATGLNTIQTRSGVGLNVTNTQIGSSNITFRSITVGNATADADPAQGILLNTTGLAAGNGGLIVTGNGGTCTEATPTCTGGRIQNTVGGDVDPVASVPGGTGISLRSTKAVSLTLMRLDNHQNYAIHGTNVVGFSLSNSVINGTNGTNVASPFRDSSIRFDQLTGSNTISNSVISGGFQHNILIDNQSGTSQVVVTGCTIKTTNAATGDDGFHLEAETTAVLNAFVTNNSFSQHGGDHFNLSLINSADVDLTFTGNAFAGGHAIGLGQGLFILGATFNGTFNYDISNNGTAAAPLTGNKQGGMIHVNKGSGTGTFSGRIQNNFIGNAAINKSGSEQAFGIYASARGAGGSHTTLINNNTVRQYFDRGIVLEAGEGSASFNATVTNNTVDNFADAVNSLHGIHSDNGILAADANAVCIDMQDNLVANAGNEAAGGADIRLRKGSQAGLTLRIPGLVGTTATDADNKITAENPNATTVTVTGANYSGGAACTQPTLPGPMAMFKLENPNRGYDLANSTVTPFAPLANIAAAVANTSAEFARSVEHGEFGSDRIASITSETLTSPMQRAATATNNPLSARSHHAAAQPIKAKQPQSEGKDRKSEVRSHHARTARAVTPPMSGETVNYTVGTLPGGKKVRITFQVTIDVPFNGGNQISNQGSVTHSLAGSPVLTDDPATGTADDATITPVAGPPVANDDNYAAFKNTPLNVPAPGVLANDSGSPTTITGITGCADVVAPFSCTTSQGGTVVLESNGAFAYTPPNATFTSPPADTFTYTNAADSAVVTITVADTSAIYISEVLFDPPGSDAPNEYIELRGPASGVIPAGTYLIAIEGDAADNPGNVTTIINLSGLTFGTNGYLVLLQMSNVYVPAAGATVLTSTTVGFGGLPGGIWSADASATDLPDASTNFMLIQAGTAPTLTDDIDADNNGGIDGTVYPGWSVRDSIGAINASALARGYGAFSFRNQASSGTGVGAEVNVPFIPGYVGRVCASTGSTAADWVSSGVLGGLAPNWTLGSSTETEPASFAGNPLDHIGAINFVNSAPVNTVPGTQVINEDATLTFNAGNGNLISVADSDAGGGTLSVTISMVGGQLTLSQTTGLAFSNGDGTDDTTMTFTGNLSDINAALNGLLYETTINDDSDDVLTLTVNDQGNTGGAACSTAQSDTDTVNITVNSVNDAPVLDNTGNMSLTTIPQNVPAASNPGDLVSAIIASAGGDRITDVDAGAVEGIAVTAVDNTNGTWEYSTNNGGVWTPFGSPSGTTARLLAADANTRIRFQPNAAFSGTVNPGITFRAWDQTSGSNGGTGDASVNGGTTAFSTATETASITVSSTVSVQDAAVPEPSTGTVNMVFTVTLNAPAAGAVSVNFTTQDEPAGPGKAVAGTCGAGGDYTSTNGTVNFSAGQQVKTISVPVCSDGTSEPDETFLVVLSSPSGANIGDGTATGTIKAANTAGTLLISEFRQVGPGPGNDPLDDFVEIYNNTNAPITVPAGGYGLFRVASTCSGETPQLIGTIPAGTVIPARGHFLFTGPIANYSLKDYGGANAAVNNALLTADLGANENFGLFGTTDVSQISSVNRFDAVGFGVNNQAACDLLREGTLLPALTVSPTLGQHSYFRKMCDWIQGSGCTVPGVPKDSNVNADDFWLADTNASAITGRLGAPGPENLTSPVRRDSANNPGSGGINVFLLDGSVAAAAHPNRARDTTMGSTPVSFGTMTLRYRVTNNTGGNVTRLRYRVVDISTAIQPAGPTADLRALTSSIEPGINPINDPVTCSPAATPCTVTVQATTLETPPAQPVGGGYNSTLSSGTITTGTPLGNGNSILINFKLGVEKTGQFRFYIIVEALP